MRRILTILAVLIVIAGCAVAVYIFFFSNANPGLVVDDGIYSENPFGTPGEDVSSDTVPGNEEGGEGTSTDTPGPIAGVRVAPNLIKITPGPVARGILVTNASTTPVASLASTTEDIPSGPSFVTKAHYIDRQSGNMYVYNVTEGTSERVTNHTAPGVQEVSWLSNGSLAFLRFLVAEGGIEHIETYALPADGSEGRFLARDLSEVAVRGNDTLFTLTQSTSGSVGSLAKPDGSGTVTLFSSPLSAVEVAFAGTNMLAHTKPSRVMGGYVFLVQRPSGTFSKLLGPLFGVTALPSYTGKQLLVTHVVNGAPVLSLFDVETRTTTTLPVATLTEKCVWAPDGLSAYCAVPISLSASGNNLPDSWYQGTVSFSDRLWKIDLTARVATLVANLPDLTDDPVDAVSLSLDAKETTLVFLNKRDGSLWAYSL